MIRAFFAIDLPESIKAIMNTIMLSLESKLLANTVRWVNPQQLHVTLQFIETIEPNAIPELLKRTREKLSTFKSFDLELGELELFPHPSKARIISFKLKPEESLAALSKIIGAAIKSIGYPIENRPFRAHLTLGRIDHHHAEAFRLPNIEISIMKKIPVNEIVLFKSELSEGASYKYTLLEKISL